MSTKATIEEPPRGVLRIEHIKGKSPIVQLLNNPKAETWINQSLQIAKQQLELPYVRCVAPETYRWAYYHSLHRLLELLKTKEPINLWDVNREFAAKNDNFNDSCFGTACNLLFSP
jgi:hypothetical protein